MSNRGSWCAVEKLVTGHGEVPGAQCPWERRYVTTRCSAPSLCKACPDDKVCPLRRLLHQLHARSPKSRRCNNLRCCRAVAEHSPFHSTRGQQPIVPGKGNEQFHFSAGRPVSGSVVRTSAQYPHETFALPHREAHSPRSRLTSRLTSLLFQHRTF